MAQRTDLRPRTVGEMLDGSFFLYRRHFGRFLLAATIVSIPTLIVAAVTAGTADDLVRVANARYLRAAADPSDPGRLLHELFTLMSSLMPLAVVQMFLQALSRGAIVAVMTVATVAAVNRSPLPSCGGLIRAALPRIPGAVLALLIQNIVAIVLLVCCFPVAIVAVVFVAPMAPLIVLEQGPLETALRRGLQRVPWLAWPLLPFAQNIDSFGRSWMLTMHAATIARGSLYYFFVWTFVLVFVTGVSMTAWTVFDSQTVMYWMQYYLEVLFLPSAGIATALWALDLRVRREGADLLSDRVALA